MLPLALILHRQAGASAAGSTVTVSAGLRRGGGGFLSSAARTLTSTAASGHGQRRGDEQRAGRGGQVFISVSRRPRGLSADVRGDSASGWWRLGLRRIGGRPAAAEGAVQRDPGGDAFALQLDQRALRLHRGAARVFQLEQAGQAALVARLGGAVASARSLRSRCARRRRGRRCSAARPALLRLRAPRCAGWRRSARAASS